MESLVAELLEQYIGLSILSGLRDDEKCKYTMTGSLAEMGTQKKRFGRLETKMMGGHRYVDETFKMRMGCEKNCIPREYSTKDIT